MSATHCLYAFGIVFYVCFIQQNVSFFRPNIDHGLRYLHFFMLFTGLAAISLYQFAYYQVCTLALSNRTTNEHLRGRWNGDKSNTDRVNQFRHKASCCSKLRQFLFSPLPESKLASLSLLLATYQTIGANFQESAGPDNNKIQENTIPDSPSQEEYRKFLKLYSSLQNANILKNEYGIEIPDILMRANSQYQNKLAD